MTNNKQVRKNKKMSILHVASFSGNIGDTANHQGFYKKFSEHTPAKFNKLEIRKFYKNRAEMSFDESFANLANRHGMLILGGGGFFDLKWNYSPTGTTISIPKRVIDAIHVPVLVNAMGYHEFGEVKESNVVKFKEFLETITAKKNWFISVRNDGSLERMNKRYGHLTKNMIKVPDHGFFFDPKKHSPEATKKNGMKLIGVNVTNELFTKYFNKKLNIESFNRLMSKCLNTIFKELPDCKIMFFAHTHQDINTLSKVMDGIEDVYKRERIMVSPFGTDNKSVERIFDLYRTCLCVIGMRFHANVCSIGMNIPTVGLAGHEQVLSLYDELSLQNRCIKIDNEKFSDNLLALLKITLRDRNLVTKEYMAINKKLSAKTESYHRKVKKWLD